MRRASVAAAAAVAALAPFTLACAGDDGGDALDGGATTTAGTGAASTPCAPGDADPAELDALLAPTVPPGFGVQPDEVGDTGPSDLAKAIRDDPGPDAEAVLTDLAFRRGYQRLWTNEADDALIVYLYEFCAADGAAQYIERGIELITGEAPQLEPFEIAGRPDAQAFYGLEGDQQAVVVAVASGPYAVQVVATAGPATPRDAVVERITTLLETQLAVLPS